MSDHRRRSGAQLHSSGCGTGREVPATWLDRGLSLSDGETVFRGSHEQISVFPQAGGCGECGFSQRVAAAVRDGWRDQAVSVGCRFRLHAYGEHHPLGSRCWKEEESVSSLAKWLFLCQCGARFTVPACFFYSSDRPSVLILCVWPAVSALLQFIECFWHFYCAQCFAVKIVFNP